MSNTARWRVGNGHVVTSLGAKGFTLATVRAGCGLYCCMIRSTNRSPLLSPLCRNEYDPKRGGAVRTTLGRSWSPPPLGQHLVVCPPHDHVSARSSSGVACVYRMLGQGLGRIVCVRDARSVYSTVAVVWSSTRAGRCVYHVHPSSTRCAPPSPFPTSALTRQPREESSRLTQSNFATESPHLVRVCVVL